jgi:predicted DsbA family dithiol-disulfide isomerase
MGCVLVAHIFEELVEKQRAAQAARARVQEMRDALGAPAHEPWTEAQTETYETAWRAWRDLARDVQAATEEYAKDEGLDRAEVVADVERAAGDLSDPSGD